MKRCPSCNDFALYDDNIITCPICDALLETYDRRGMAAGSPSAASAETVRPRSGRSARASENRGFAPRFETINGRRYHYRGVITEIRSNARLSNRLKKWVNSIFRGEPYQFGDTAHETIIRIEEFRTDKLAGRKRDLIFYGDVEGRFNHGDDASITAVRRGERYVVTRMYLNETETYVRPRPQIPAWLVAAFSLILLAIAVCIIIGLVGFIASGALFVLLEKAVYVIVIILIIWQFFRRR